MGTYRRGKGNYRASGIFTRTAATDETVTSSTTYVNSTFLKVPLKKNTAYSGICWLRVISPTAADIKFTFVDIASAVSDVFDVAGAADIIRNPVAFGSDLVIATDGSDEYIIIYFTILVSSTAGDLQLQFSQNSSDGGNTILQRTSFMAVFEE